MRRKKEAGGCGCLLVLALAMGAFGYLKDNPGAWKYVGIGVLAFIAFGAILGYANRPCSCAVCGSEITGKDHDFMIDGKEAKVCTSCARNLRSRISKAAVKAKFGE